MQEIQQTIAAACRQLFNCDVEIVLSRPNGQFGDYSTNVALRLSKQLGASPVQIARQISQSIEEKMPEVIKEISVARQGFINIVLKDSFLAKMAFERKVDLPFIKQEILVEFGDPNPLKAMHLGHLYTAIVGDTVAHLFETGGAIVKRLSYHGDVGMHVAKCLWAIRQDTEQSNKTDSQIAADLSDETIGRYYAAGARAFADDEQVANSIKEINASIYNGDNPELKSLYNLLIAKSFAVFDQTFNELGINYDKRYLESASAKVGVELVKQNVGEVFEESDGAIVYKGEDDGLHTRVFINSRGLPTYEAKDLGLAIIKDQDFPAAALSVVITAREQAEYFKVMLAALSRIEPEIAQKTRHLVHGFLSLTTGKMSSRTGQVYTARNLLAQVKQKVTDLYPNSDVAQEVYLAAIKYTFLKQRLSGDVVFDVQESVATEGNSGPYLQYAHARARSILNKLPTDESIVHINELDNEERALTYKISEYTEVVNRAISETMPHHICTYLYELAQEFNRFYEKNRVLNDSRQDIRSQIVAGYADVLKSGLELLNIPAPERM